MLQTNTIQPVHKQAVKDRRLSSVFNPLRAVFLPITRTPARPALAPALYYRQRKRDKASSESGRISRRVSLLPHGIYDTSASRKRKQTVQAIGAQQSCMPLYPLSPKLQRPSVMQLLTVEMSAQPAAPLEIDITIIG